MLINVSEPSPEDAPRSASTAVGEKKKLAVSTPTAAVEQVVAITAEQHVAAVVTEEAVVADAPEELVVAGAAADPVVAATAGHLVVAVPDEDHVIDAGTEQHVIARCPDDRRRQTVTGLGRRGGSTGRDECRTGRRRGEHHESNGGGERTTTTHGRSGGQRVGGGCDLVGAEQAPVVVVEAGDRFDAGDPFRQEPLDEVEVAAGEAVLDGPGLGLRRLKAGGVAVLVTQHGISPSGCAVGARSVNPDVARTGGLYSDESRSGHTSVLSTEIPRRREAHPVRG